MTHTTVYRLNNSVDYVEEKVSYTPAKWSVGGAEFWYPPDHSSAHFDPVGVGTKCHCVYNGWVVHQRVVRNTTKNTVPPRNGARNTTNACTV